MAFNNNHVKKELKQDVFERDGFKCKWCGKTEKLVAHHILPRSFGGKDEISNLATMCLNCNSSIDAIICSYYRSDFNHDRSKITFEFCLSLLNHTHKGKRQDNRKKLPPIRLQDFTFPVVISFKSE